MLDIIWNAVEDEYLTVIMYLLCSIPMRFSRKTSKMIHNGGCCHWTWWIIRPVLSKPISGWTFVIEQSRQVISSRGQALSEFFCWHLHRHPRGMTLQPALASVALKQKPVAMGERAPRAPSSGGLSCPPSSRVSALRSVAPAVCPPVLAAAGAPRPGYWGGKDDGEFGLAPGAHGCAAGHQRAPPVAFFHLAIDQARCHLPLLQLPPSSSHFSPLPKMSCQRREVEMQAITGEQRQTVMGQEPSQGVHEQVSHMLGPWTQR